MDDQTGMKEPKGIMRFPRLPKGKKVSELAKGTWTPPTFEATEIDGTTTFTFRVPTRERLRSLDKDIYRSLFESGAPAWTTALESAYSSAGSGKKSVAEFIDIALYKVFLDALKILIGDAKSLATKYEEPYHTKFVQGIEVDLAEFAATSRRARGPKKRSQESNDKTAIRLYERYAFLKPLVGDLKKLVDKLKTSGIDDEGPLNADVASGMRDHEWIRHVTSGAAFLELPPTAGHTSAIRGTTLGEDWAPWQLTAGVIRAEEAEKTDSRHKALGVVTIYRRIMRGKKLLTQGTVPPR
jgi:hypothetical protein